MNLGKILKNTVNTAFILAGLAYATGCVIKTTQLNRELQPLMNQFRSVAESSNYELSPQKLDYRGKLTEIKEERDKYLAKCGKCSYLRGPWTVSIPEKDKPLITLNQGICLNPFANIPKYQGK